MKRRGALGVAAVAVGAVVAGALWRRQATRPPAVDADALWTLRLPRPDGGELVFAELRGRPLLVNFWASWCAPCVKEMPELDRFHRDFAPRGIAVVGLAIDNPTAVREFLQRTPVGFPIGIAGLEGAELLRRLGNNAAALPYTVLLDAAGKVRRDRLGETTHAQLSSWASEVLNRD